MARSVGMREFKNRFNEIVREMEDSCEEVVVTRRGREVFRAVPTRRQRRMIPEEIDEWNARMDALAKEIGKLWPKGLRAADAISEDRSRLERY